MSTIDRNTLLHVLLLLLFAAVMGVAFPLTKVAEQDITPLTLAIGILSTGLGYAVLNYLIAHAGVIFAATSGYFIPVFAIVMSYFLVEEPFYLPSGSRAWDHTCRCATGQSATPGFKLIYG